MKIWFLKLNISKPYSILTSQIVECNALPTLILMLRSEDTAIHYEAVGSFEDASYIINYLILQSSGIWCLRFTFSAVWDLFHGLQVGVIGNLVHSSPNIKKEVLLAGALQPVIGLLRCVPILNSCHYSMSIFFVSSYYYPLQIVLLKG